VQWCSLYSLENVEHKHGQVIKNPRELKNQNKKNQLKEWLMNQLKESAKEEIK